MGANSSYKDIPIRIELIRKIDPLVEARRYSSISEFVHEAVRLRLEQLQALEASTIAQSATATSNA
jgi:Arc/MetJ-type ribon-helix-helix transcriptional regulator